MLGRQHSPGVEQLVRVVENCQKLQQMRRLRTERQGNEEKSPFEYADEVFVNELTTAAKLKGGFVGKSITVTEET